MIFGALIPKFTRSSEIPTRPIRPGPVAARLAQGKQLDDVRIEQMGNLIDTKSSTKAH
jgi:hypothetical protein